jgi:tetratricopeptide (TPR) repeat protein
VWLYLIALAAPSAFAASGDEFYDRLYTRGVGQFAESNYAGAYASMKIAAFGYLENIPRFQTAEIYMTVAASKLRHDADARAAAVRVIAAERIEKRYASLSLPADLRKEFEDAARKLLTADNFAALRGGGTARPPQPQPQQAPKTTEVTIPAPVLVSPPQPQPSKPAPTPVPKVTTPAPQPQPRPVQPQPAPVPATPAQVQAQPRAVQPTPVPTAPVQVQTQPRPAQPTPVPTAPAQVQTQPRPVPPQPQPQPARPVSEAGALADADRAVNRGDLAAARTLYRSLLDAPQISHATALRVAEGLYRSRDFAGTIRAFERAGAIGKGEEQYHYYYAVALYESGRYAGAKRELRAALSFIEVTPDVERYRVKIEGAIE